MIPEEETGDCNQQLLIKTITTGLIPSVSGLKHHHHLKAPRSRRRRSHPIAPPPDIATESPKADLDAETTPPDQHFPRSSQRVEIQWREWTTRRESQSVKVRRAISATLGLPYASSQVGRKRTPVHRLATTPLPYTLRALELTKELDLSVLPAQQVKYLL
jgi:hypothetical protein